MCTALTYQTKDHYFGRNLDLEYAYDERVTITPRNYKFRFRHVAAISNHYAMIGIAYVVNQEPLYYEASNEKGLSIASLNFPGNAVYYEADQTKDNIASFELIPWILSQCANCKEALEKFSRMNIINTSYSKELPTSPLHWIVADRDGSFTVETMQDGMKIYDNTIGVLTNNPPFDYHLSNLVNYMSLSRKNPTNQFAAAIHLNPYCYGMGGLGLPGDLSSTSRFVRCAFNKMNSVCEENEESSVQQFFYILASVYQMRGCSEVHPNVYEFTRYSSCCNVDKGIYYYRTYDHSHITAIDMHKEDLDATKLIVYPLISEMQIPIQNG